MFLGVLMARWKTAASGGPASRAEVSGAACAAHVSRLAAAALVRAGAPQHCYKVLAALLPYWKEKTSSEYTVQLQPASASGQKNIIPLVQEERAHVCSTRTQLAQ